MVKVKTLIVGSNSSKTAEYYQQIGCSPSILITSADQSYTVGHTSPQDIPLADLERLIKQADQIYWAEPLPDEFEPKEEYYTFLNWLKDIDPAITKNVRLNPYGNGWVKNVKLEQTDAVFLGCSFTAGIALSNPDTHYANIVSKHFGLRAVNLAEGSGSNGLSFDKFTQLDFHPGQVVILQLTSPYRIHYTNKDKHLLKIMFARPLFKKLNQAMMEVYHKDFLFYETLTRVRAMVQVAEAKQLKLVFWLINYKDNTVYSQQDQQYFYHMKQFVPASVMADYLVDFGEDKSHPGILSNQFVAKQLIDYIKKTYEI
jgi:hypothetical protein